MDACPQSVAFSERRSAKDRSSESTVRPLFASPAAPPELTRQSLQTLIFEISEYLDEIAFCEADCPDCCTGTIDPATQRYLDYRLAELTRQLASCFDYSSDAQVPAGEPDNVIHVGDGNELCSRVQYLRELLLYGPESPEFLHDLECHFHKFVLRLGNLASELTPMDLSRTVATSSQRCHRVV
jgi:hypothetical protein